MSPSTPSIPPSIPPSIEIHNKLPKNFTFIDNPPHPPSIYKIKCKHFFDKKPHAIFFLSYKKFINKTTDMDLKKYLKDNLIIYQITSEEKLYQDLSEEEKNRIYQNAIKPNENRNNLENKAIEMFGKDKVEIID